MKHIVLNNQKIQILFKCEKKYKMYSREYADFWFLEGNVLVDAFEKITNLKFTEKKIIAEVGKGDVHGDNNAGNHIKEAMLFRYNIRNKSGTLFHELGHRLILEYNLFEISKNYFQFQDLHQILDLFLFDVMEHVYGTEAAKLRVDYEKSFTDTKYEKFWNEALSLSKSKRNIVLQKIIRFCKSHIALH